MIWFLKNETSKILAFQMIHLQNVFLGTKMSFVVQFEINNT